jgi:hypothetical protein
MGFFDKFVKGVQAVKGVSDQAKREQAAKEEKERQERLRQEKARHEQEKAKQAHADREKNAAEREKQRAEWAAAWAAEVAQMRADLVKNLHEMFASEYPKYEVKENVDVKAVDPAQEFGGPIDFALYNHGKFVGAVMLLDKGKKRTKRIHGVELACKKTGAGYANFYTDWNDAEYFPFSRPHAVAYLKKQIH